MKGLNIKQVGTDWEIVESVLVREIETEKDKLMDSVYASLNRDSVSDEQRMNRLRVFKEAERVVKDIVKRLKTEDQNGIIKR